MQSYYGSAWCPDDSQDPPPCSRCGSPDCCEECRETPAVIRARLLNRWGYLPRHILLPIVARVVARRVRHVTR